MADVPRVAVDIAPVHALVARVMEGVGTPDLIVPSGESPHGFSMRPSSAQALQDADVVFWVGHGLTPQLEDAIETLAEDAAVTELLEAPGTTRLEFREDALFEAHDHDHGDHDDHGHDDHDQEAHGEKDEHGHDDHDHAHDDHGHDDHAHDDNGHDDHAHDDHGHDDHGHEEVKADAHDHDHDHDHGHDHAEHDHGHDDHDDHAGHDHGAFDPHAWLSLENADQWLNLIAAELSAADPDNAGAYFTNAGDARAEIAALREEVAAILDPVRGGNFIVFHDAYQYFEAEFDFPAAGAISIGDASDPSPARIAEIQGRIRDEGVDCVLSEPQFNPGLVATVLEGTEAQTSVIDPLGADLEPGPALYPQLIRNMANALADCL